MARVVQQKGIVVGIHSTVLEPILLDEAPAEVAEEVLWPCLMMRVVASVQMPNAHTRICKSDSVPSSGKLGEPCAQMPRETSRPDRLAVVRILRDRRTGPLPFRVHPERLTVHPIRFGKHQVVLGDAELIGHAGVCKVPRVGLRARRSSEIGHVRDEPLSGPIDPEGAARRWAVEHRTEVCSCSCCTQRRRGSELDKYATYFRIRAARVGHCGPFQFRTNFARADIWVNS